MNLYLDLFLTFAKVGVCTFGGGYAMLPILQREVVERGLTLILSTHDRALAQDYADILYELKEGSLYEVAQSHL